jgi:hypothetical protein
LNDEFWPDNAVPGGYVPAMSKAEILSELPKLTREDRDEIRLKLAELDGGDGWLDADDPLTGEEKALLEARLEDMEKHPEKSIPWAEAKKRIEAKFGK